MGNADVVPGVSGGTVALLLGIYDHLIDSIGKFDSQFCRLLVKRNWRQAAEHVHLRFILSLLLGIFGGIICMGTLSHWLLEHQQSRQITLAAFSGMVLASCFVIGKQIQILNYRDSAQAILLGLIGIAITVLVGAAFKQTPPAGQDVELTVQRAGEDELLSFTVTRGISIERLKESNEIRVITPALGSPAFEQRTQPGDVIVRIGDRLTADLTIEESRKLIKGSQLTDPTYLQLFCFAAIAICAMILPGISGALILMIFGVYEHLFTLPLKLINGIDLGETAKQLIIFACGAACGLIVFSRVLRFLLTKYRHSTLSLLVGIMLGSLSVLWPFQDINKQPLPIHSALLIITIAVSTSLVLWLVKLNSSAPTQD